MDADGRLAETAALTVEGRPVAAEQALAATPFELAGRLSDDMRSELEQRLSRIAIEQPDDPAFRDVPATDVF